MSEKKRTAKKEKPYKCRRRVGSYSEVVDSDGGRVGWLWFLSDGRVVACPHLGKNIWCDESGNAWSKDSACEKLLEMNGVCDA